MNDVIHAKLKKSLNYKILLEKMIQIINQNAENLIILVEIYYRLFLRDIHEEHLSIEKADNKQNNFANEINSFDKGIKTLGKSLF